MERQMTKAEALIRAALAAPKTHVVLTLWDDGHIDRHESSSLAAAENWAVAERRRIGREFIRRNPDLTAGPKARVVSVEVLGIA